MRYYIYEVEIKKRKEWITEKRYYRGKKDLNDFDLYDIIEKRRNAKYIGVMECADILE